MNHVDERQLEALRALFQRGETDTLVNRCESLLGEAPEHPRVMEILALALSRAGRRAQSLAILEQARRAAPDDAQINYNLAVSLQESGDDARAMLRYRDCLRAAPDHADALWNYGELLRVNDHFAEALACFERLLESGGKRRDIHHRMAVCHAQLGDDKAADRAFRQGLDGNSSDPSLTHWEYAHFLLSRGEWEAGWRHYDHRFETTDKTSVRCHPFDRPPWDGSDLDGRHLLVHGEQGLGDEIMFCSVVPELARSAGHVTVACQPPLARLFAQSFDGCTVLPHRADLQPAPVNMETVHCQAAMGSLARYRRNTPADFARSARGYLRAAVDDRERFAELLRRLAPGAEHKVKVGLMWGSNPAHGVDWGERRARRKSVPVSMLSILGGRDDVQFVSLQNRDNGAEAAWAPSLDLVDLQDELLDLADTAGLIASIDLVISVDTSVAHLAGAMGVPVWIPLMKRCDWRWGLDGDTTPWYDSARLFRQSRDGDWDGVVAELNTALDVFLAQRNARSST